MRRTVRSVAVHFVVMIQLAGPVRGAVLLRPPLPKPLFSGRNGRGESPGWPVAAVDVEVSVEPGVIVTTPGVEQGTGQSPRILGFEKGKRPYRRCPFCKLKQVPIPTAAITDPVGLTRHPLVLSITL